MTDTIHRAFELARSGACVTMDEIRAQLKQERYAQIDEHLSGRLIKDQLRNAIAEASRK